MEIDHLVYAAPDLPGAVTEVEGRFGVRAQAGGKHNGSGTRNALLALGAQTYLEIIAPDPGQPTPSIPRPFGVDDRRRGGLASWALACDDIDAAVARARSRGYPSRQCSQPSAPTLRSGQRALPPSSRSSAARRAATCCSDLQFRAA